MSAAAQLSDLSWLGISEASLRAGTAGPNQLWYALAHRYGVRLPRKAVCPGHVAPMDAFWRSWTGEDRAVIWMANRGGGKTNGLAFLESLEAECKGIGIGHVAATLDQGSRMQTYASQYFGQKPGIVQGDIKQKVRLRNGGLIEILPATMAGVNGPHPVKVSLDECDLMKWPVIQQAMSMPLSVGDNLSALRIASTRKFAAGPMQRMIDSGNFRVAIWCIFETMQACTEASCKRCERLISHDRLGRPHTFAEVCGGKMRESRGFMPWQDIIDKFVGMFHATWVSQWECKRPEQIGAYYAHYQPEVHNLTDVIADWRPSMGRGLVLGLDFGVADPNALAVGVLAGPTSDPWKTIVWCDSFEDGDGDTIVESWPKIAAMVEQYRQGLEPRWRDNVHWFGDPAGRARQNVKGGHSAIKQIKNSCGVRVRTSPRFNSYQRRHDAVENRLRVRSDGEPRVYFRVETPGGKRLARCIEALRRPLGRDGQPVGEEFVHDEHSHLATAVEFATVGGDYVLGHAP